MASDVQDMEIGIGVAGFDWFTLNIVIVASKYTCRLFLRVDHWPPDVKEILHTLIK